MCNTVTLYWKVSGDRREGTEWQRISGAGGPDQEKLDVTRGEQRGSNIAGGERRPERNEDPQTKGSAELGILLSGASAELGVLLSRASAK